MRLSVVVPMYNAEGYVAPLLECLSGQGLAPRDYEVLVLDDGSTDGTAAALEAAAATHPELRVVTLPHGGNGVARNRGIEEARGEYLYFMDCDDGMAPGALARLLERAEKDRLDLLLFGGEPVYETPELEAALPAYRRITERQWAPEGAVDGLTALVEQVRTGDFSPCVWLIVARVAYLRESGARFAEGIINEDNIFVLQALSRAARVGVDQARPYRYYVRQGSQSSRNRAGDRRFLAHLELLRMYEEERWAAIRAGREDVADAIEFLSDWFVEVCVRTCPEDVERAGFLRSERFHGLVPAARVARKAADERARAEEAERRADAAEAELASLRERLAAAEAAPGVRAAAGELAGALRRRLGRG